MRWLFHNRLLVMAQAAQRQQVDIDRISFIDAARWLAAARDEEPLPLLVINLHRPYRYEPRVRKRRPKQYPLMQTPRGDVSEVLVCYSLGVYEMQSNPQANRVIA
jgi:hypothetical protein